MKLNLTLFGAILIILGVIWLVIIYINSDFCFNASEMGDKYPTICSIFDYTGLLSLLIVFIGINLFFVGILYKPKKKNKTLTLLEIIILILFWLLWLFIFIGA